MAPSVLRRRFATAAGLYLSVALGILGTVAAARILAPPLRAGAVTSADLDRVQERRERPTKAIQGLQRVLHLGLGRILAGNMPPGPSDRTGRVLGAVLSQLTRVTSIVPAYVIGVGLRPERAPEFARRSGPPALPQD